MLKVVMMDAEEWDRLPARLAEALHEQAVSGPGRFTVVDGESGEPIRDRLKDWLCGTLMMAFHDVTENAGTIKVWRDDPGASPREDTTMDTRIEALIGRGRRWDWVCEFCHRTAVGARLPDGWDWAWQSAACPDCQEKVARDGGYHVVRGGAYAGGRPDPRSARRN